VKTEWYFDRTPCWANLRISATEPMAPCQFHPRAYGSLNLSGRETLIPSLLFFNAEIM
jgi:hypothetical protein